MLKVVKFLLLFLLAMPSETVKHLSISPIYNNRDGSKFYDSGSVKGSFSTTHQQQHRDWILSVLNEVMARQNQRRSFLENYDSKDQDWKIRSMAFKEQMDKEEIVHLKRDIGQLQEIADSFQHYPESLSSHFISKRQTGMSRNVITSSTTCSMPGTCVMTSKFCPHPDIPKADASADFVSFVVRKHVPYSNNIANKAQHQLQFEEALLNFGGSFKLNESVFVAPKSGIYEFNFDGHKSETSECPLNISLRINGKEAVNAFSDFVGKHDFRNLISMHSFLKLKRGDRIDLYVKQGSLARESIDTGNNNIVQHSQFTGKLLLDDDLTVDKELTTTPVYFNVQKNACFCSPKASIPFEIVNINVGGAFDLKVQKFISPMAGIYEFTVKGFKTGPGEGNNDELNLSMRLNGNPVVNTVADYLGSHGILKHSFHTSFSIYSILKLEKGDQIDLFLAQGCLYDDMNHLTQFTGKFLLEYNNNKSKNKELYAGYFYVQKNDSFSTANAVIPFEVEVLNIGGAFILTEHFFRAPKSGIYEFNAAGIKNGAKTNLRIALRLNSNPVAYVWAEYVPEHGLYTPFSLHYVMQVKAGDRIDLFNEGEGSMLLDDQRRITHFTGKLLFATDNIV